jgi:hypothetical protein
MMAHLLTNPVSRINVLLSARSGAMGSHLNRGFGRHGGGGSRSGKRIVNVEHISDSGSFGLIAMSNDAVDHVTVWMYSMNYVS